ncbi:MAG: dTDP-glucose 4,6-dehydratase [Verrucomicrobiota bacterium]|nr:dTDP-glucose 4,6-dehydratase [Verrucomicrobiota bacterium]
MRTLTNLFVTGGCGFIGSAFIRYLLRSSFPGRIVNYDKLTYAANTHSLNGFQEHPRYRFIQGDINNTELVERLCLDHEIDAIVHFAAETHVDRSIASALPFIETNVKGTLSLLEVVRRNPHIHFHHISTDEVYGALSKNDPPFRETSPYHPNSPYSASKAASDHLVRAYATTYGISTTLSHCSNNYGPWQHPEKFIPLMLTNCLQNKALPVYGRGEQIRDWLYVDDHVEAILAILERGKVGETYDIGGNTEKTNLQLLDLLIEQLATATHENPLHYHQLLRFVTDRPGHDFRYAIDTSKIHSELGWQPKTSLRQGLQRTIQWLLKSNAKQLCT